MHAPNKTSLLFLLLLLYYYYMYMYVKQIREWPESDHVTALNLITAAAEKSRDLPPSLLLSISSTLLRKSSGVLGRL